MSICLRTGPRRKETVPRGRFHDCLLRSGSFYSDISSVTPSSNAQLPSTFLTPGIPARTSRTLTIAWRCIPVALQYSILHFSSFATQQASCVTQVLCGSAISNNWLLDGQCPESFFLSGYYVPLHPGKKGPRHRHKCDCVPWPHVLPLHSKGDFMFLIRPQLDHEWCKEALRLWKASDGV